MLPPALAAIAPAALDEFAAGLLEVPAVMIELPLDLADERPVVEVRLVLEVATIVAVRAGVATTPPPPVPAVVAVTCSGGDV